MSLAKMTMIGMEHYLNIKKLSLFDNFELPDGVEKLNVVNAIMLECGEMEVLYSDADFFRHAISSWSAINVSNWKKIWNVLNMKYNPIENYDRMEEWVDDIVENENGFKNMTGNASDSDTGENLSQVSAFNSSEFANSNRMTTKNSGTSNSLSRSDENFKKNSTSNRKGRTHGNIGVLTSQAMVVAETEVAEINFYTKIAEDFKKQFCVMVY